MNLVHNGRKHDFLSHCCALSKTTQDFLNIWRTRTQCYDTIRFPVWFLLQLIRIQYAKCQFHMYRHCYPDVVLEFIVKCSDKPAVFPKLGISSRISMPLKISGLTTLYHHDILCHQPQLAMFVCIGTVLYSQGIVQLGYHRSGNYLERKPNIGFILKVH